MLTEKDKGLIEIDLLCAALSAMNRELTACLAIVRDENKLTACSLCGEERDSREIQDNNGYCQYCKTANMRSEFYREREHPDQRG